AVEVAVKPGAADGYSEAARLLGQQGYLVPQPYLDEIGTHPVAIDPYDTAIAIDYKLDWRPMPVFQSYVAYTPYLDDLNARAAQDAPGDQYVLRRAVPPVDGRNTVWETPAYLMTLACDYTRVIGDVSWTLLRHSPEPHCEGPQDAGSVDVTGGRPVKVPEAGPDEMVVARFDPDPPGMLTKLFHAALKDFSPYKILVDGVPYRIPEALATQDVMVTYPDQGELGLFAPFRSGTLSYPNDGSVHFSTIKLDQ
ncbi:MAG: hypothetical protein ABIO16_09090, partial [Nocardioides sp.]